MCAKSIGCILVLVFSIAISVMYHNKSQTLDIIIDSYRKLAIYTTAIDEKTYEINSIGYSLDDIYLSDIDGNKIHLSDVVNNSSKIVFIYSPLQCNSCYESQLELLRDNCKDTRGLIILTHSDINLKKMSLIHKTFSLDVPVYKLTDKELPLPVDTIGKPFFFKIDANLYSGDIFIPNKNIPQLTTAYINRTLNNSLIK